MARIENELSLADKFSSTWNSFISMAESAVGAVSNLDSSTIQLENTINDLSIANNNTANSVGILSDAINNQSGFWTDAVGNYSRSALEATYTTEQLVDAGFKTVDALNEESYEAISAAASISDLSNEQAELNNNTDNFSGSSDDMVSSLRSIDSEAQNLANNGFEKLLKKLERIIATFLSFRSIIRNVKNAITEEAFEVRFIALFDDQLAGEGVVRWARNLANEYGELTESVLQATNTFARYTTNGQNLRALNDLSARIGALSSFGDFDSVYKSISQAFRTGNIRGLSTQTGITRNILDQSGVTEAAQRGDVNAFIEGLQLAADMVGYTDEAYERFLDTVQIQSNKFFNGFKNNVTAAARQFINAFAPTFRRLNEWLSSDNGQRFFNGLSAGFALAGAAVSVFVDALISVASFISDNFTYIVTGAVIALSLFAARMLVVAASVAIANAPLFLFIGLIGTILYLVVEAGTTIEDILVFVGGLFGLLYTLIYNIVVDLHNAFVDFAEFFANFLDEPVDAIKRLFVGLGEFVIGVLSTIAGAIDFLFGSNLSSAVDGWLSSIRGWANENIPEATVTLNRLDKIGYDETIGDFINTAAGLGRTLDNLLDDGIPGIDDLFNLEGFQGIDSIGNVGDVGTVGRLKNNEVTLSDEDLKKLVDLAERRNNIIINQTLRPNDIAITVNNMQEEKLDENKIANAVSRVLDEQSAVYTDTVYE